MATQIVNGEQELDLSPEPIQGVTARMVAQNIHDFAIRHGLLGQADAIDREVEEDQSEAVIQRASRFEQQNVIDIFRSRPIRLITFDERNRLVTVFTDKAVGVKLRRQLPNSLGGSVAIQYMVGRGAEVRGCDGAVFVNQPYSLTGGRYNCGGSVFPANLSGAGTFGAIVRNVTGTMYGLSNNHVTGGCNNAEAGLPILAPGPVDVQAGRMDPFTIGRHVRLLPIHDGHPGNIDISANVDAAIFEIMDPALVSSMQGVNYDTPSSIMDVPTGGRVEKVGRTTGHTVGTVIGASVGPIPVSYEVREFNTRKVVFFPAEYVYVVKADGDNYFSTFGDSGSLVTHMDAEGKRHAVGLVFAGDERAKLSFILPIALVLEHFQCSLVSGHGTA